MKSAFAVLLGVMGAIVPIHAAFSQVPESPLLTEPQSQSLFLTTQPIALKGMTSVENTRSPWSTARLNSVANSIQSNPAAAETQDSVIPSNFIPKDLFHTPSRILSESHPLEVFQPPAPNQSFGINLNRL